MFALPSRKAMATTLGTYLLKHGKAWLKLNVAYTWDRYSNDGSVRP